MSAPTVSPFFYSSDVPTPFNFYYSPSPSISYYPSPPPYPINYGTPQNPNQVPILRFLIYLACTITILAFILYLNKYVPSQMDSCRYLRGISRYNSLYFRRSHNTATFSVNFFFIVVRRQTQSTPDTSNYNWYTWNE